MTRFAGLLRLQEIDSALDARRASRDDARSRLHESEEVAAARIRAEETARALRASQGAQKDIELQADEIRAKIGPAEQKLYSGAIKNPKELADLQADIDQLKRQLSAAEDRDLDALSATEEASSAAAAAQAEADAVERAWREEQAELTERASRLDGEIADLEDQRNEQARDIDSDVLRVYDHIRRAHQGRGVARLDRNLCLGCRISLPTNIVNRARAGSALVQCPNCERILFA